ncbi:hypothetical protein PMI42_01445 [Bradyrhizobium sp. YR681]|uniref:hypothetical protein n=1 Tax=Bradyrhizobium sp. YR681 TaxID=1144344 RepID=UPI000270F5CF|nr:hypothetical protein [Bradyrhizobium sp. YR681]EJN14972.1 hypothetical protein PMI42_01445 [Bradyrhizobium sp. YR681]
MINILVVAAALASYALMSPAEDRVQSFPKQEMVRPALRKPATAAPSAPIERGPCQIGVIPIAGIVFMVEKFGPITLLDNYSRVSVATWGLDDLVVSRVRAAAPGSSVRRIPFTKDDLKAGGRDQPRLFASYRVASDIENFVRLLATKLHCERYVVVHRHGGSQREFGIGISQYPLNGPVHLFAMMYIRVYDGATFALIREAPALTTEDTFAERVMHNPLGGPSMQVDRAMFPEKPADAVNNPVLRDGVRAMLTKSLDKTLPALLQRSPPSR